MPNHIPSIMAPESIAVVGATNRPGSVGQAVFRNILNAGYNGVLYPVNPKTRSVQSVKAYPSLGAIQEQIDAAVIIVPPDMVADKIEEAADAGVKGVVIITAGFKEIGGIGVERENRLKALARRRGISVIGPNCLGVINTSRNVSLNASFASKMPLPGNISFISQSGALCTSVLDYAGRPECRFFQIH